MEAVFEYTPKKDSQIYQEEFDLWYKSLKKDHKFIVLPRINIVEKNRSKDHRVCMYCLANDAEAALVIAYHQAIDVLAAI